MLPLVWDYYLDLGGFAWWQVILTERLGTALMLLVPLAVVAARRVLGALPRCWRWRRWGPAWPPSCSTRAGPTMSCRCGCWPALLAVVLAARWLERALPAGRAAGVAPAAAVVAAFAIGIHNFAGAEAPWREITWSWSRAGEIPRC